MTDYPCPIEGCDFEGESKGSLRGHITGTKDGEHIWAAVKNDVDPIDEDDDQEDVDDDGDEGGPDNDQEDDEMPTEEEYQRQQEQLNGDRDDDDGDSGDGGGDTGKSSSPPQNAGSAGAGSLSVPDVPTWLIIATAVAIAAAVYLLVIRDGSDDGTEAPTSSSDSDDQPADYGEAFER